MAEQGQYRSFLIFPHWYLFLHSGKYLIIPVDCRNELHLSHHSLSFLLQQTQTRPNPRPTAHGSVDFFFAPCALIGWCDQLLDTSIDLVSSGIGHRVIWREGPDKSPAGNCRKRHSTLLDLRVVLLICYVTSWRSKSTKTGQERQPF